MSIVFNSKTTSHKFHILPTSALSAITAISSFFLVSNFVFYWNPSDSSSLFLFDSIMLHCSTWFFSSIILSWLVTVLDEFVQGRHSSVVKSGLQLKVVLFIVAEVMFFFSLFWAFFHYVNFILDQQIDFLYNSSHQELVFDFTLLSFPFLFPPDNLLNKLKNFLKKRKNVLVNKVKSIPGNLKLFVNNKIASMCVLYKYIVKYTYTDTFYSHFYGFMLAFYFVLQIFTGAILNYWYNNSGTVLKSVTSPIFGGINVLHLHSSSSFVIFILLYIHMARGLFFKSYVFEKRWSWFSEVLIFVLILLIAFVGCVLHQPDLSFWNIKFNLVFSSDRHNSSSYNIFSFNLKNFYWLHAIFSILALALIYFYISNVLLRNDIKHQGVDNKVDSHNYFTASFFFYFFITLIIYFYLVFFKQHFFDKSKVNSEYPAITFFNAAHEWYLAPFYSIFNSFSNSSVGFFVVVLSFLVIILLPWIHFWLVILLSKFFSRFNLHKPVNVYALCSVNDDLYKLLVCFFLGSTFCQFFLLTDYWLMFFFYFLLVLPILSYFDFILVLINIIEKIDSFSKNFLSLIITTFSRIRVFVLNNVRKAQGLLNKFYGRITTNITRVVKFVVAKILKGNSYFLKAFERYNDWLKKFHDRNI